MNLNRPAKLHVTAPRAATTGFGLSLLVVGMFLPASDAAGPAPPPNGKTRATPQQAMEIVNSIPGIHLSKGIPVNFPIPIYATNVVRKGFINSTKGPPTAGATIVTTDSPQIVFNWYQNACKQGNWIVKIPTPQAMEKIGKQGKLYIVSAEKDDQQAKIFCIQNKRAPGTIISISWNKKR